MFCRTAQRRFSLFVIVGFFLIPAGVGAEKLQCPPLKEAVQGEEKKYSVCSRVDGPEYFADIRCALLRRKDLCAMELSTFDLSGRVYDYYSGAEVVITEALYVVVDGRIHAFSGQGDADRFIGEQGAGESITFEQLTAMRF